MMNEEEIKKLIQAELEANLRLLIDPNRKDSFSSARIKVWKDLVTERICYQMFNKQELN